MYPVWEPLAPFSSASPDWLAVAYTVWNSLAQLQLLSELEVKSTHVVVGLVSCVVNGRDYGSG